jgi:hypothetical protein
MHIYMVLRPPDFKLIEVIRPRRPRRTARRLRKSPDNPSGRRHRGASGQDGPQAKVHSAAARSLRGEQARLLYTSSDLFH